MLTGCRRDEIRGLRKAEIALGDSLIVLPGERTKNGREHAVPLSAPARAIVESLKLDRKEYAFGERDTGYSGGSRAKESLDAKSGVTDWTLHDLRRTAATRMADLAVFPHVIEAALNHVSGHKSGVAGIYNRAKYEAQNEKRSIRGPPTFKRSSPRRQARTSPSSGRGAAPDSMTEGSLRPNC
jgi:integrase